MIMIDYLPCWGFGVDLNYKGVAEMRGMRGCVDAHHHFRRLFLPIPLE